MQPTVKRARAAVRLRKRLLVRVGYTPELGGLGFTVNMSTAGMALSTRAAPKIGSVLFLELNLDDNTCCRAEGVIVWARRGLGPASDVGIRFTKADVAYKRVILDAMSERIGVSSPGQ